MHILHTIIDNSRGDSGRHMLAMVGWRSSVVCEPVHIEHIDKGIGAAAKLFVQPKKGGFRMKTTIFNDTEVKRDNILVKNISSLSAIAVN